MKGLFNTKINWVYGMAWIEQYRVVYGMCASMIEFKFKYIDEWLYFIIFGVTTFPCL